MSRSTLYALCADKSAWETCSACKGYGLELSTYTGEPVNCSECKGDTVIRARDPKGRFVGNPKERQP